MTATKRLLIELNRLENEPVPLVFAKPLSDNILEWRFIIQGAVDTIYTGGLYQGRLVFPPDYPWAPPSIYFITPSGRMKLNQRICLSISDFHPKTWTPSKHFINHFIPNLIIFIA